MTSGVGNKNQCNGRILLQTNHFLLCDFQKHVKWLSMEISNSLRLRFFYWKLLHNRAKRKLLGYWLLLVLHVTYPPSYEMSNLSFSGSLTDEVWNFLQQTVLQINLKRDEGSGPMSHTNGLETFLSLQLLNAPWFNNCLTK